MYSVPVTLRQVPGSWPVTLLLRSTWMPLTSCPESVCPTSVRSATARLRLRATLRLPLPWLASVRPASDCTMRFCIAN